MRHPTLFNPSTIRVSLPETTHVMRYIILAGDGDRNFIAERQSDGSYKKIAQAFDNKAAANLVQKANGDN